MPLSPGCFLTWRQDGALRAMSILEGPDESSSSRQLPGGAASKAVPPPPPAGSPAAAPLRRSAGGAGPSSRAFSLVFLLIKKIGKFNFLSSVTLNIFYLSDGKSGMSQVLNKYLLLQVKTLVFNREINWFSPVHYTS